MFLNNPIARSTLIAVALVISGCAGLPSAPAITDDSPLVDVLLPDLVLGKSNKDDPVLRAYSKTDAFRESVDIQSFCKPGGLSRYGGSFIDANDARLFDEAMGKGLDVAKRRHEWTFETAKLNKQSELLNAFLSGRGGAFLTPEKFDLLRREEAAYRQWNARVAEARQNTRDGNLSADQMRQLQSEFPKFRMGRTSMHLVPAAVDGVNYNSEVLKIKDKYLQEDERWYAEKLSAVYKGALQKQIAMAPDKVSLEQMVNFDIFKSYSVMACLSRGGQIGRDGSTVVANDSTYEDYARKVISPKLPGIYRDLASAKSSDALQLGLENRFPTRKLAAIALNDSDFSKKTSNLMSALRKKEDTALAERRRQESQAVAAVERQKIEAFRQKASRGVVPSKDEFLKVLVDTVYANTQERRGNFANKFVRGEDASFSQFVLSLKTSETSFQIDNLRCVPSAGKLICSWTENITFTDFDLFRNDVYQRKHEEKAIFGWTDYGLRCLSDCGWYIGRGPSSGRTPREDDSDRDAIAKDMAEYNREASERFKEREEANMQRDRNNYNDNQERIRNSNGRCPAASICPY